MKNQNIKIFIFIKLSQSFFQLNPNFQSIIIDQTPAKLTFNVNYFSSVEYDVTKREEGITWFKYFHGRGKYNNRRVPIILARANIPIIINSLAKIKRLADF